MTNNPPKNIAEWDTQVEGMVEWAKQNSLLTDDPSIQPEELSAPKEIYPIELFDHIDMVISSDPLFETQMKGNETKLNELALYKTVDNPSSLHALLQDGINAHAKNVDAKADKTGYKKEEAEGLLRRVDGHIRHKDEERQVLAHVTQAFDEQNDLIPSVIAGLDQGTKKAELRPSNIFIKTARLIDERISATEAIETTFRFKEETEKVLNSLISLSNDDIKFLGVIAHLAHSNVVEAKRAWVEARMNVEDIIAIEQDRQDRRYHSDYSV